MSTPLRHLLFPTDLSPDSDNAFATALRATIGAKGTLEVLHVTADDERPAWKAHPTVREWLNRWGRGEATFEELGIKVNVHSRQASSPAKGVLRELEELNCDLVVMSTQGRSGIERLAQGSVSETIASKSKLPCLFVPRTAAHQIVGSSDGQTHLQHVVFALGDPSVDHRAALQTLRALADSLDIARLHVQLVHYGSRETMPDIVIHDFGDWSFDTRVIDQSSDPTLAIVEAAHEMNADLIVMATRGRTSLMKLLLGSNTERVVHRAPCPVLSVPVG